MQRASFASLGWRACLILH